MADVVWRPEGRTISRANVSRLMRRHQYEDYWELVRRSQEDPEWFWPAAIEDMGLDFSTPWNEVMDLSRGPEWATWFIGAKLSIAWNCVHRWSERDPDRVAAVGLGEDGARWQYTFAELSSQVTRLAEGLVALGVEPGDRVAIYMPMCPEVAVASHACAHIGAVQLPIFSGFAGPAVRERLQDSDEFASAKLGLQWSWNHNPDNKAWSLKARPGFLRLKAGKADYLVTARNTLTQVLQGPSSTITVRIDLSHIADGQRAGLSMFGVGPSWIGAVRDGGTNWLTLSAAGKDRRDIALKQPVIELRVAVSGDQKARYAYSLDGGRSFIPLGEAIPLSPFSWWKGSRPALFTYNTKAAAGWIDVDWVHVATERMN